MCGSSLTLWGLGFRQGLLHWIQLLEVLPYYRISVTLSELVSLVKVFRLFELEWIVLVFREVDTIRSMYNILSIGRQARL